MQLHHTWESLFPWFRVTKDLRSILVADVMKTAKENKEQESVIQPAHLDGFDFEQWARQVRPLLLASVQKRGSR